MWLTQQLFPAGWAHRSRVLVVALVLSMSACTVPGHSSSTPATHPPNGEPTGQMLQGDGDGGGGM
jgi:hypothetical protein